jgi:serine phosphatase RsbU (regulator of sigma subunit)
MLRVRIVSSSGSAAERTFFGESVVIGTHPAADISLNDPQVAHRHLCLESVDGGWFLRLLSHTLEARLNGVRTQGQAPLKKGDELSVGAVQIQILAMNDDFSSPPSGAEARAIVTIRSVKELLPSLQGPSEGGAQSPETRRYSEHLRLLTEIHRALAGAMTPAELYEALLESIFVRLRPADAVIFVQGADGGFDVAARRSHNGLYGKLPTSRVLLNEIVEKQVGALITDPDTDILVARSASLRNVHLRSLIAAPILDNDESFGVVALSAHGEDRVFTETDLEVLAAIASVAALRQRNLLLLVASREKESIEADLLLAREIQDFLQSSSVSPPPECSLFGKVWPSRYIAGDLLHWYRGRGESDLFLLVADVSGKGVPAALLAASLEAVATINIEAGACITEVLRRSGEHMFARSPSGKFATAFLAHFDGSIGKLRYASAGHNPALLLRASGIVEHLGATGVPLGLLPQASYREVEYSLTPGDLLVVYSDGITEASDQSELEFGLERLQELCLRHSDADLASLAWSLDAELATFSAGAPRYDDCTLLLLRYEGLS